MLNVFHKEHSSLAYILLPWSRSGMCCLRSESWFTHFCSLRDGWTHFHCLSWISRRLKFCLWFICSDVWKYVVNVLIYDCVCVRARTRSVCKNVDRKMCGNYSALTSTIFSPWGFLHNELFLKNVSKDDSSHGEAIKMPWYKVSGCPLEQLKQLTWGVKF